MAITINGTENNNTTTNGMITTENTTFSKEDIDFMSELISDPANQGKSYFEVFSRLVHDYIEENF